MTQIRSLPMAQALHEILIHSLSTTPTLTVLSEEFPGDVRALPDRWWLTPVADRGTVGMAVGMALGGRRPVVCLSGTSRLPAILAPLSEAAAVAQRREFSVPLVIRVPYGTEATGLDQPVGRFLSEIPGLTVACASSPGAAAGLLRTALSHEAPIVLLEPRALQNARTTTEAEPVPLQGALLREGSDVTLAAWGAGVDAAHRAADALAREGTSADVIDLVCLAPLDRALLRRRVRATGRLVVVHPGDPVLARHVRQVGLEEAFLYLEAPMGEAPATDREIAEAARAAITY